MQYESLKKKLEFLLPVDKIEGWESLTRREQDFCYELLSNFHSVKNRLSEAVKIVEDNAKAKNDVWLNEFRPNRVEIKAVREGYVAACKKGVKLLAQIINQI